MKEQHRLEQNSELRGQIVYWNELRKAQGMPMGALSSGNSIFSL